LPPLSSEIFTEKVLANKASTAATAAKASFEKSCAACQKTYYSENAYNNHLNSQKHKSSVAKLQKGRHAVGNVDDAASVMSSAFSLGEPLDAKSTDGEADEEFSKVVNDLKQTSLNDGTVEPLGRRPSRPHHSGAENRPEHPLSRTETASSTMETDDASTVSSTKPQQNPLLNCLFCNYLSPTFPLNIHHMGRFHGMFIPEKDYLEDPEGLVKYLHTKIQEFHQCLYCGKTVHTAEGIQTHMRDRGHCKIGYESEEELIEIGQFYDFSSTYPDAEEFEEAGRDLDSDDSEATAEGGVKLGTARRTTTTVDGQEVLVEEDEGWETDSTVSSVPTDEITSVPIDDRSHRYKLLSRSRHHSHGDPRPHRNADGFHSHAHATPVAVYHDEYELHLPTGRTAGHRSLNRYFRQNLRNYPGVAERMEAQRTIKAASSDSEGEDNRGRGRQLISRADGGLGLVGVSDAKKAELRATEKRERKREERARNKYQAGNEKRGNFQKHFRVSPWFSEKMSRNDADVFIGPAPAVIGSFPGAAFRLLLQSTFWYCTLT
jgi:pre-60S factor REI1